MIHYSHHTLANGLQLYIHPDPSTPLAVVNLLYRVGSRNEAAHKTGFAHLFEHLMFGGSANIPSYDEPLQRVGGENNAFTSPDITNYYCSLPADNIETALWLESDRMLQLSFDPEVLEVQRKVVIEEFKQRYLNQPYGDVYLKLRPLVYKHHPYRWPTIGKEISHIEEASMEDVKDFFYRWYRPNNAILVLAGKVTESEGLRLAEKWFGDIPAGEMSKRALPQEPYNSGYELLHHSGSVRVPADAVYRAYKVPGRTEEAFFATDLLGDLLGRGKSSRLYKALVEKEKVFTSITSHTNGSLDTAMFTIEGKVAPGVKPEEADAAIDDVLETLKKSGPDEKELDKVKVQAEAGLVMGEVEVLNRAVSLAMAANLGHAQLVNTEVDKLRAVSREDVQNILNSYITSENLSTLIYHQS